MPVATTTYTVSRPSYSSNAGPSSPDTKKHLKKEDKLILQHGSRLHSYGRDKAPYPFSYDREVLESSCLERALMYKLKGSVSYIDFKDDTPMHCLDLGTGLGDWVIDAAKQWPDCTFVGYDLVNVQVPLAVVDESIARRIQWVHGNFLRQKLPFEDDEFDHVHIHGIAFAVPEHKWNNIYEEVRRVLRPGGTIEVIEEDAVFPTLPRWFTAPLHVPSKRPAVSDGTAETLIPQPCSESVSHDHALLESLFYSVFHNRFLNPTPSSMLPSYFSVFFGHVLSPPVINFPMPPIAPMLPASRVSLSLDDPRASVSLHQRSESPTPSDPFSDSRRASTINSLSMERTSSSTTGASVGSDCSCKSNRPIAYVKEGGTSIGGGRALGLFPTSDMLNEHSLFLHLRRAVCMVLATKEAMWDELKERIEKDKEMLTVTYGWESADFEEETSRQIFDALVERYKDDMHIRVSMWHVLQSSGWEVPRRDPLSKAEHIEDQRFRRAILEGQKQAPDSEVQTACRSVRLLVGVKVVS